MKKSNYEVIRDHTCDLFLRRWAGHDLMILQSTLLSMLRNQRITAESLAEKHNVSVPRVAAAFESSRYDLNDVGQVVDVFGVGIDSSRPYRVDSDAASLHICCSLVSLMVCQLSADASTILTKDPISGQEIKVSVTKTECEISPVDAVGVLVAPPAEAFCDDPWNTFCKHVRLYESEVTAKTGSAAVSSAVVLPVGELMKIASFLSRNLWISD